MNFFINRIVTSKSYIFNKCCKTKHPINLINFVRKTRTRIKFKSRDRPKVQKK
ncbi:hypothetical protein GLOIN_2v1609000 [Rhizophagus irregularis DAOM 181602=DAOM 197198]|uniref:Uncharacterized protein n=1 Tax=Rhizophagus irregularis (strain DAOM 181602 / DAOM 197198 / MUCL 43194) TaxID=747089 RepID=A0A2P4Q0H3_RHIID|nr:hypothetical protein GLOIN_2v1609000 [Rhizophagus irregularis DAOM 181602=DAOM 197198]POG71141.1 hypothetical protein GLOIN_2v1609000 [Rhizophagus irregularis DAOM 181602=DAOM 197198]|eukprot:XP_025178007.1 hypothetical protein GLOIN_2v1609000 [Rhizophagus irregularis DAOM 181602=DAOM 197198]